MSKGRAAWIGAGLLAALLAAGLTYQSLASARDRQRFPPPGRLIEVDGFRLHLFCSGSVAPGAPTVILEGGLGAPGLMWARVQPELARTMRVCSYDRAGYGWSQAGPRPRDARRLAAELHQLLSLAGERPPFVLVGHSLGGVLARVYAAEYPAEAAGLVLVDARQEDFFRRLPASYLQTDQANDRRARWLMGLTPFGVTRLLGAAGQLPVFERYLAPLPDEARAAAWALMIYNPQHWVTAVAEREAIEHSYDQVRPTALPADLPLVVLTAEGGLQTWSAAPPDEAAQAAWMAMQAELASLTRNSQWLIVKDSGHYIYLDQPQAVVQAVQSLGSR